MAVLKRIKLILCSDCLSDSLSFGFITVNKSYFVIPTCVKSIEVSRFCYLFRNFDKITEMEDKRNVIDKFKGQAIGDYK